MLLNVVKVVVVVVVADVAADAYNAHRGVITPPECLMISTRRPAVIREPMRTDAKYVLTRCVHSMIIVLLESHPRKT